MVAVDGGLVLIFVVDCLGCVYYCVIWVGYCRLFRLIVFGGLLLVWVLVVFLQVQRLLCWFLECCLLPFALVLFWTGGICDC